MSGSARRGSENGSAGERRSGGVVREIRMMMYHHRTKCSVRSTLVCELNVHNTLLICVPKCVPKSPNLHRFAKTYTDFGTVTPSLDTTLKACLHTHHWTYVSIDAQQHGVSHVGHALQGLQDFPADGKADAGECDSNDTV